jgi:O-antigen ligase
VIPQYLNSPRLAATAWVADSEHLRLLTVMMWALIVLMIVPDGFDYRGLVANTPTGSGGLLSRSLWMGLMTLGGLVLLWRIRLAGLLAGTINLYLLLFVGLAFMSVAWSIDPSLSLRRLIRLGTMVLACSAFVLMGWHARRFQQVVRPVLTLVLLGSIIFGLLFPSLAIHQEASAELAGAWRGLANHKNGLGALASLGMIFWLHAWLTREARDWTSLWGAAIAATCLLLSRSSTALIATVVVMFLLAAMVRTPRSLQPVVPALVWILSAVLLVEALALIDVIPHLNSLVTPITALTGKDNTLTGRTEIWEILSEHIRLHPLLGTGYAAYWTPEPVPGNDSFAFVTRMRNFYPGSAHNGYLEVINDLGWAGFLCLLGYIFVYLRQALRLYAVEPAQASLYLALFFQQAITNLSESHWFSVLSVDFVIMTLATMVMARTLLEYRLRTAFGRPRA